MGSNFVQVKEAIFITPSQQTPNSTLSLSSIDSQLFLRFTVEYLLVFNATSSGLDHRTFSARIKSALGRALVQYYPLAGRVQHRPDRSDRLQVVCRAQGVVFVEATSGYTRADFERAPRFVEEWRQLLYCHVDDVLKGAPPLVVQLTWLADGAVALAFGFNHCVCDGIGSAEFVNSFAELTRGVRVRGPQPVWDRFLLDPFPANNKPKLTNSLSHPEFCRVQDRCGFLARFSTEPLVPTSSVFPKFHINELKRQSSLLSGSTSYTSFEVISAHIWRCWAKSLNMPSNQVIKLLFSVNVRNRIKPGLPAGFYGNGFVLGCAQTTVKELTEKGLAYCSDLIRIAKEKVDDKHVREVIELVSGNRTSPDLVGVLILSQWSRLGLESVDFGLGSPAHVGPICSDRYCLLLPVHNQREAVRVMLAVPTNAVDMYQHLMRKPFS
nr:alcohol acyltransferase 4 [Phytolacca americana]WOE90132.1 alcohol acyltransferase 4 [Phytolacca icosandra]